MSGGSFDYLYCKDADQLPEVIQQIDHMADALDGMGQHMLAVRTRAVKTRYDEYMEKQQKEMDHLREVWRAIEMWYSCDSDEAGARKVIEEYWGLK
jgi:hypothetical protein